MKADCDFCGDGTGDTHPEHPCGHRIIDGVTTCRICGHLDGSADCRCWTPATQEHVDYLICEAMEPHIEAPAPLCPLDRTVLRWEHDQWFCPKCRNEWHEEVGAEG